jgi:hypothetical protein
MCIIYSESLPQDHPRQLEKLLRVETAQTLDSRAGVSVGEIPLAASASLRRWNTAFRCKFPLECGLLLALVVRSLVSEGIETAALMKRSPLLEIPTILANAGYSRHWKRLQVTWNTQTLQMAIMEKTNQFQVRCTKLSAYLTMDGGAG